MGLRVQVEKISFRKYEKMEIESEDIEKFSY